MELNAIEKTHKICPKRISADCCIIGSGKGWVGRCCPKCFSFWKANYYQRNKKAINDKTTQKRRMLREQNKRDSETEEILESIEKYKSIEKLFVKT